MTRSIDKTRPAGSYLGDLLRAEWHRGYCCVSSKLVNCSSTAITGQLILGQPVKVSSSNHIFVKATDEANATGIVLDDRLLTLAGSGTTDEPYLVLKRGPALIDQDALPTKDMDAGGGTAGTAFTIATLVTAYAALSPPIIVQRALSPTKTQSL
jgi:hypothetical protein